MCNDEPCCIYKYLRGGRGGGGGEAEGGEGGGADFSCSGPHLMKVCVCVSAVYSM